MNIHVKCFANLANSDFCNYDGSSLYQFDEGATINDLMHRIQVTPASVKLIFLNGKHAEPQTVLSDGDQVALAPATG